MRGVFSHDLTATVWPTPPIQCFCFCLVSVDVKASSEGVLLVHRLWEDWLALQASVQNCQKL